MNFLQKVFHYQGADFFFSLTHISIQNYNYDYFDTTYYNYTNYDYNYEILLIIIIITSILHTAL